MFLEKVTDYEWYRITGNDIKGYILFDNFTRDDRRYPYLYADHVECFDKESKCPLSIRLPESQQELLHLAERLRFWGSKDGYNISNEYNHALYDTNEYPKSGDT